MPHIQKSQKVSLHDAPNNQSSEKSVVTLYPTGERLGDKLIIYSKALFFARNHNLLFFRETFQDDNLLALGSTDRVIDDTMKKNLKEVLISGLEDTAIPSGILYKCYLFPEGAEIWKEFDKFFEKAVTHKSFLQELRTKIYPVKPIRKISLPSGYIKVAIHMRKGGGYDFPLYREKASNNQNQNYADKIWPLKFPPDSFYINSIKKLAALYPAKRLYIYIFTDDPHPEHIAHMLKQAINHPNIKFDFRKGKNNYQKFMIDDLFNMSMFDCLIRPESSFSMIAQLIGNHRVTIYPRTGHWENDQFTIDQIGMAQRKSGEVIFTKI